MWQQGGGLAHSEGASTARASPAALAAGERAAALRAGTPSRATKSAHCFFA